MRETGGVLTISETQAVFAVSGRERGGGRWSDQPDGRPDIVFGRPLKFWLLIVIIAVCIIGIIIIILLIVLLTRPPESAAPLTTTTSGLPETTIVSHTTTSKDGNTRTSTAGTPSTRTTTNLPSPTTTQKIPTTTTEEKFDAVFLMSCEWKPSYQRFYHFCWAASNILVAYFPYDTLLRFDIDTTSKTCKISTLDKDVDVKFFACTKEGRVYSAGYNYFTIFDIHTGRKEIWYPPEIEFPGTVAENGNYIVVGDRKHSIYVYDKNRVYLYWRNFYTFSILNVLGITEDDKVLLYFKKYEVHIHDLHKNSETKLDAWEDMSMVCFTPDNKIMAVEYWDGHLLVYSPSGRFLYQLNWDLDGVQKVEKIAVTTWKDKPTLMALNTEEIPGSLRFYLLN